MNLGEAIRTIRIRLELTQAEVCKRTQLTQGFYSAIETGRSDPSFNALYSISNALGLPMAFIIWKATERRDLTQKQQRAWYDNLNPIIDALIEEATTTTK